MTEGSSTRIINRLERILEAADEIHPMDIAEHIKDDTLWEWAKGLRDRIYERVGEIEDEVREEA